MHHRFILQWHNNFTLFSRLCKRVEDMKVWSAWSPCTSSQKQMMRLKLVLWGFNAKRRRIQEEECMSSSAEKRSYGRSSGQDRFSWASGGRTTQQRPLCLSGCKRWWSWGTLTLGCRRRDGQGVRSSQSSWCPPARRPGVHDTSVGRHNPPVEAHPTHTCTHVYLLAVMTDGRIISKGTKTSLTVLLKKTVTSFMPTSSDYLGTPHAALLWYFRCRRLGTHIAGVLPSGHVPCTHHGSAQPWVLGLTHVLRDDGNLQLLEGFWIGQGNCMDRQSTVKKVVLDRRAREMGDLRSFCRHVW